MSELTLAEPLRDPPGSAVAPPTAQRWGFWATGAWGLAAAVAFLSAQTVATIVVVSRLGLDPTSPGVVKALGSDAIVVSATTLAGVPAILLVIALAVRLARVPFAEYLALKPVGVKVLLVALASAVAYGLVTGVAGHLAGVKTPPFTLELYRTARESGTVPLILLAVGVGAPLNEEFLFRGFLLRGWANSRLGAVGAIVLTSAIWAAIHIQYDWIFVGEIFGLGLLLGYLRLRTGSLLAPLLIHGLWGIAAVLIVGLFYS